MEGLWVRKWKVQNGFPYLTVDFVWGFWLPLEGWRWSAFVGWQSCGCCWEPRMTHSFEASCLVATWVRLQRPAFSAHGCWHWLSGRPGPCVPVAPRSWHRSPCTHISLRPFSSPWKSEACGRCHCLGLSLSEKLQGEKWRFTLKDFIRTLLSLLMLGVKGLHGTNLKSHPQTWEVRSSV